MTPSPSDGIRGLVCGYPSPFREKKPIVVLEGFADDSCGSEPGRRFLLAGFVATSDQWLRFADQWAAVCAAHPATPDFHTVEAWRLRGRYRWKDENERDAKFIALKRVIEGVAPYRVDCVVSADNYDTIARGKVAVGVDHPYFTCFYSVILSVAAFLDKCGIDGTVDWVFDEQGALGLETVNWYYWIRENAPAAVKARLGSTPVFRDDARMVPLKAADFFAWHIRRHIGTEQPAGIAHGQILEDLLALPGVSSQIRPEDLERFAASGGTLLKTKAEFKLPNDAAS